MFGYVFFLIVTYPLALLVYSVVSEKIGLESSRVLKSAVYGFFCSPCVVVIGESYRNKTVVLGLYAIIQGYDVSLTVLQMVGFTIGLYLYFCYKGN